MNRISLLQTPVYQLLVCYPSPVLPLGLHLVVALRFMASAWGIEELGDGMNSSCIEQSPVDSPTTWNNNFPRPEVRPAMSTMIPFLWPIDSFG